MSGKGDDYRPVNKKRFDESMDRIFGKKDPLDYQKGNTPSSGSTQRQDARKNRENE
jgi:hypothetical protein